jgi:hypothetical protein
VNVIVLHLMRALAVALIAIAALEIGAIPAALEAVAFVPPHEQEQPAKSPERRAPESASTTPVADPGWPRAYTTPAGARVQIYQPQIASWEGHRHLVAYVAVAHRSRGAERPVLGTLKVEAETTVALQQRLVSFAAFRITETNFGSLEREATREIVRDVERAMPEFERVIALDRVLASIDASQIRPKNVDGVKADPPTIFFSTTPAVLVSFDGDPIWSPIQGSELRFAINTNWDVFEHSATKTVYLRNDYVWLKAPAITGPWMPAGTLPDSFSRLPSDQNWKDVKASLPGRKIRERDVPTVLVSTSPAELILLRGTPSYVLVSGGTQLLWVNNTESDVFRLGKAGPVYYLVAGRWFSAPDFRGPWTFATPTLPSEFKAIPVDHPRARVLASVPGTRQAAEAVVLAQIPQTARVNKTSLKAPDVQYQGEPLFRPIEQTSLQRAVNTDKDIIRVGALYYLCFQGVWFVSTTPQGPWEVAASVPPQIYSIPPSSPVHHVTYVTVVDNDSEWVVFATGAGYTGVTIAWGCAVWGTGWYYPPYVWYGGYNPVYYPFYPTYGYSAWYNPWSGTYARGAVAYGPYGGVGAAARYNPTTGTYARGAMAWGPYGANGVAEAYNPRTGVYGQTRQAAGVYGSWGTSYVQRGDNWAQTTRATDNITGTTARVTRTDDGGVLSRSGPGGSGFVAAGEEGVYAGRDGNVYRRADGGGWQKYENGSWGTTQRPDAVANAPERATPPDSSTIGQLERDRSARIDGTQRTRDRGVQRSGGRPTIGGSRPSGARGGGRRR